MTTSRPGPPPPAAAPTAHTDTATGGGIATGTGIDAAATRPAGTTGPARGGHRLPASGRLTVLGNPGHRRVTLFAAAARAAGLPEPTVLPWIDVLHGTHRLPGGSLVRIESPGEDEAVDALLRGPALGDGYAPTRVEGGAAWYARVTTALRALEQAPGVRLLGDPGEIAVMFDKRRTHALLSAAGVPVPRALGGAAATGWEDLRERLAVAGLRRVFLKPSHGSSASGVVALEFGPRGQVQATTSVELAGGELHNSLQVRRYRDEPVVAELVDRLAPDGLHVEQWVPKAAQSGRSADLRVVVIAGRATHVVVRTSPQPMTNLHLGGSRGSLALAREAAGPAWPALLETAERAARCFPNSPMVGVDVLPVADWRRALVGEVNAFGDLLPDLTGLPGGPAEGLDTYAAQLAALLLPGPGQDPTHHPGTEQPR
ncbi:STM4014 family protein [Streptomyces sp. BE20]|uniref:STM4014 family protein n=1 Tax=Streptomyces sp. BE20 TaxID=3002525 RepID=UPI002E78A847|nr:STM4014 family protein [Streptomyces sp. BE20]MEE1824967.1 STM4014 family protein [Streptomyces sp. BE20]